MDRFVRFTALLLAFSLAIHGASDASAWRTRSYFPAVPAGSLAAEAMAAPIRLAFQPPKNAASARLARLTADALYGLGLTGTAAAALKHLHITAPGDLDPILVLGGFFFARMLWTGARGIHRRAVPPGRDQTRFGLTSGDWRLIAITSVVVPIFILPLWFSGSLPSGGLFTFHDLWAWIATIGATTVTWQALSVWHAARFWGELNDSSVRRLARTLRILGFLEIVIAAWSGAAYALFHDELFLNLRCFGANLGNGLLFLGLAALFERAIASARVGHPAPFLRPSSPGDFPMAEPLRAYYADRLPLVEKAIHLALTDYLAPVQDERLAESIRYSMSAGGKRIRSMLLLMTAEAYGLSATAVLPMAVAIELLQTFTLIHDDLPALDNSDYRRGRLANHKAFEESTAILTGDALLSLGFELMAGEDLLRSVPAERVLKAARLIGLSIGARGVIGGECLDVLLDKGRWRSLSRESIRHTVRSMNRRKTAVFVASPLQAGALLAGAPEEAVRHLEIFGEKIGEAFQIADDLRDIEEDEDLLSYPNALGIEESVRLANRLLTEAKETLLGLGSNPSLELLRHMADYVSHMIPKVHAAPRRSQQSAA
jgi:geranylgeranyl diphosphate synthase, type II